MVSKVPKYNAHNIITPILDHNPIVFDTAPPIVRRWHKRFKLKNRWLVEARLKCVVKRGWSGFGDLELLSRVQALGETSDAWGNKANSKFRWQKRKTEGRIQSM